ARLAATHLGWSRNLSVSCYLWGAGGDTHPEGGAYSGRGLASSAVGKSLSTICVTLPVAAHSAPRCKVTINPAQFIAAKSWPSVVWKIRPLPKVIAIRIGSFRPVPWLAGSE